MLLVEHAVEKQSHRFPGAQSGRPTVGYIVVDGKVTPAWEVGVTGRLLNNGAHDGDLQIRDLVRGDGCVIHLRKLHVSIKNFHHPSRM